MKLEDLEAKLGIANMGEEDKLALVKDIQANLPALKAEQRSLEAKTQANLVVEAIKKIKEGLEARFDELNGIVDVKVRDITSGKDGIDGKDGKNGKDGKDGKDGLSITGPKGADGEAGQDGVGVQDAHIDFDGSLIITLTDGRELNVGEVVPMDVAEKIKIIGNGGGTSQSVLDSLTSLQDQINTLTGIDGTLGTMAQQDDTAVDINGGAIDGTTVGATTPAAGTFTTLTATGQTSLGGAAGSEGLRVLNTASGVNFVSVSGATAGNAPYLASTGTSTNIPLAFYTKGTGAYIFSTGASYAPQFQVSHTASAVNYVQVTGAATGGAPVISVQGSDANITAFYQTKGVGSHVFGTRGTTQQFRVTDTGSAVNYATVTGAIAGAAPKFSVDGSDTNIPLVLQPKGTGALQAQQTDSTATGGNARGANAVDWQTLRTGATQVANGLAAVIGGGVQNTSSNNYSVVCGGTGNTASGPAAVVTGGQNSTASSTYSVAAGGGNVASGYASVAAGGYGNTAAGTFNFVGGGYINSANALAAVTTQSGTMNGTTAVTLSGSNANIKVGQSVVGTSIAGFTYVAAISGTSLTLSQAASGSSTSTLSFFTPHGVVVGGGNNQATGSYSFIGGGGDAGTAGNRNVASGDWSVVVGGAKNVAGAPFSFVGGGFGHTTSAGYGSVVCGGGFYGNLPTQFSGNVASGSSAFVGAGFSNQATGFGSYVGGGNSNISNSIYGVITGGYNGSTRGIQGLQVFPANNVAVGTQAGCSQASLLIIGKETTNATSTVLTCDPNAAGTTNQVILPNNSAYYFKGTVVAGVTGGGNTKGWTVEGVIKRGANAASTALVGTPTVLSSYGDAGATTWALTATADTTNGGLAITFTGQAATTIRCVAQITTTEMTF